MFEHSNFRGFLGGVEDFTQNIWFRIFQLFRARVGFHARTLLREEQAGLTVSERIQFLKGFIAVCYSFWCWGSNPDWWGEVVADIENFRPPTSNSFPGP